MNKLPECERPSVSLLACRRAQHATPQPKRSADCPRSRGVYATSAAGSRGGVGSSPLARGLPTRRTPHHPPGGIIPARAGFTAAREASAGHSSDHPRSRGVYPDGGCLMGQIKGSSPLARGLLPTRYQPNLADRIIPARAGFTRRPRSRSCVHADHPRSRGVYGLLFLLRDVCPGSSPLARGLLGGVVGLNGQAGIIPARAGFTSAMTWRSSLRRDHPRSRGVYESFDIFTHTFMGSSPLARGLPRTLCGSCFPSRIIPARAGFTRCRLRLVLGCRDHPRSRGVYFMIRDFIHASAGSSPLARGLLLQLTEVG